MEEFGMVYVPSLAASSCRLQFDSWLSISTRRRTILSPPRRRDFRTSLFLHSNDGTKGKHVPDYAPMISFPKTPYPARHVASTLVLYFSESFRLGSPPF